MKKKKHPTVCYLRTHRRVWGLTQREAAQLLGLPGPGSISRMEHHKCKRGPSYETALACQVLFGFEPRDMYPTVHRLVEDKVIRACYHMHRGMEKATKLSDLRKRELCELALKRAIKREKTTYGV